MIRLDQICACAKPDPYELGNLLSVTVCLTCGGRCENRLPDSPPPLSSRRVSPLGGRFSERPTGPDDLLADLVKEVGEAADRLERMVKHLRERPRLEVVE